MSFGRAEAEPFVVETDGGFTIDADFELRWGLYRSRPVFEKKEDAVSAVIIGYHAWRAGETSALATVRRALGVRD